MKASIKLDGFKELEKALADLGKVSTQKAVLRRSLKRSAEPIAAIASSLAPKAEGQLGASVSISTKLSARQKKLHRKMFKNDKAAVEMFVGAGPLSSAHTQEFGTEHHAPQPFMRPAWDAEGRPTLERLKGNIWSEIQKQAKRNAKRNGWEV